MGTMLDQIAKPTIQPPRVVIHGKGGIGKTSLAADAPGVLFLPLEDGMGLHSVPALAQPRSYDDVIDAISELIQEDHQYKTLVVDTIDKLEPLVWDAVCEVGGKQHIEDFGYGKGYTKADPYWLRFFAGLDALRAKGMTTIVLAHSTSVTIDDPLIGSFSRWSAKLHKRADALLYEWADIVGYLDTERQAIDRGDSTSQRKTRTAASSGTRVLYLDDRGAFVAKNRFDLPEKIIVPKESPYAALRDELVKAITPTSKEAA